MAKIEPVESLEVALAVLAAVEGLTAEAEAEHMNLKVMSSNREQALVIVYRNLEVSIGGRQVAFCQRATSDEIVVYYGDDKQFNASTNQPLCEQGWRRNRTFGPDDTRPAAEFIHHFLTTGEAPAET